MDENFGILCFISSVEQAGILCDFGSYDEGQHRGLSWLQLSFSLAPELQLPGLVQEAFIWLKYRWR